MSDAQAQQGEVKASDFLTTHAREGRSAWRRSAILECKRPEGLNMKPLGTSWSVDVFVRVHNGVRRECIDLYNMIDSMQRGIQELRSNDLILFFRWWDNFTSYVDTALTLDKKVLLPWAESASDYPLPKEVGAEACNIARESMCNMTKSFDVVFNQLARFTQYSSSSKQLSATYRRLLRGSTRVSKA
jgi:hypothetical protein